MYLLGYDIGSSSIKIALVEAATKKTVALIKEPETELLITALQSGWAEQSPDLWWQHVCTGTRKLIETAKISPDQIQGIGIAYQMHGLVAVDRQLTPLRDAIIWCDSRAVNIGNTAFEALGETYCLTHLLNSPANFTASKLSWVKSNEPDLFKKIYKIMLPGDFIAMKMTGEVCTTVSGLSEGIFWDFNTKSIAQELLTHYGFSPTLFPTIKNTFSIQGYVTKQAAEALGLVANIPVTYRAGDQPNNALSLNVLNLGEIAATGGTSGVVYGVMDKAVFDKRLRVNSFAHVNYMSDNQRIGVLLCINGAGIQYGWLKQMLGENLSYEAINALAEKIPIGSDDIVVLPFGNGAERLFDNKTLDAHIFGLNFNRHSKGHLFRAGLEGIAFAFVHGIHILKEMGLHVGVMRVGNDNLFQSKIFSETIASLTDSKIEIIETTGAIGAAKAAGVGIGLFESPEKAMDGQAILKIIEPNQNPSAYQKAYDRWLSFLKQIDKNA